MAVGIENINIEKDGTEEETAEHLGASLGMERKVAMGF